MKVGFQHMGNLNIVLKALIENLGCQVVLGPRPNKYSLNKGVRYAPELACLPFKVTLGDMFGALERGVDTLVFLGGGDWSCRFGYYGRVQSLILRKLGYKFKALFVSRENLKSTISEILKLSNDSWTSAIKKFLHAFTLAWYKSKCIDIAEELSRRVRPLEKNRGESSKLLRDFLKRIENECSICKLMHMPREIKEQFYDIKQDAGCVPLRIRLVGESYCVIEPFVNSDLIKYLGEHGVHVEPFLTAHRWLYYHWLRKDEDHSLSKKKAKILAEPFWAYGTGGEDQVSIGYAIDAAQQHFDGVIHLMPFSCMPETAALPVFERISKLHNIPFLNITLDEHSGSEGLYTRVEAFLDLLMQRRKKTLDTGKGGRNEVFFGC